MKNFFKKGITLLEVMMTIAILLIIVGIATPQFLKIKNVQILKSTTGDIVSVLDSARAETLASLNSKEYGVHFETNRIVLFVGNVYNSLDATNQVIGISSPATISTISFAGGSDVFFNRLTGTASKAGSVVVSLTSSPSLTKTITVSATGQVSIN